MREHSEDFSTRVLIELARSLEKFDTNILAREYEARDQFLVVKNFTYIVK